MRHRWTRELLVERIREWADETGGIPPAATDWNVGYLREYGFDDRVARFYAGDWPHMNTVRTMFGTWNAAVAAAGFDPRQSGSYGRDGDDMGICREIRARYEAGESISDLAREYEVYGNAIRGRIVKAGGVVVRRLPRPNAVEIAERYAAGETLEELAVAYGMHPTTVRNRVRFAGVRIRPPGRRRAA